MSFAQTNGYTPVSFEDIISFVREGINAQFGTTYTVENFIGTNWYKFAYSIAQKVQEGEIKTAEIFQKLQQYIALTNEKIQRPSVSHPGLIDSFTAQGFVASVKAPLEADAGKIFVCVDTDELAIDYAAKKLAICTLIKDYIAAGIQSQGAQSSTIVLSNGQGFPFKFDLPTRIPVLLRLTAVKSDNNLLTLPSDVEIRTAIFNNIKSRYRLGWDFEPERYYGLSDALWARTLVLEWSSNGGGLWNSTVYDAAYTEIFTFNLADITVVIS